MPKRPNDGPPNTQYYELQCDIADKLLRAMRLGIYAVGGACVVTGVATLAYRGADALETPPKDLAGIVASAEAIAIGSIFCGTAVTGFPLAMRAAERSTRKDFRIPDSYPVPEAFRPYADQYVVQLPPEQPRPPEGPQHPPEA